MIGLGEFAGHVVGLEARAVAGEVEQVGVFEKIVRLVAHGDGQFRRERGDFRSARRDPASVLRDQFEAVRALCLSKAAQRFHVDDAGFAGEQGFLAAKRLIGIAERVEPLDHGGGPEIPGDVFLQVYHIVFAEGGPPRFAFGLFRQCVHAGGEGVLVGRGEVAAVGVVGIRQDFDDIQFGQQAQFHGKHGRGAARRQGEARDEARGLLDEVGLSGLARAEHAHAHFPRGGGGFLAQGTGEPVALAQERLAGGACGLRVCPDPFVNAGERFDARFALFDKFLIVYGHKRNASRRAGENRPACDARKARKLAQCFMPKPFAFSAQNTVPPFRASQSCPFFMSWNGKRPPLVFLHAEPEASVREQSSAAPVVFHAKPGNFAKRQSAAAPQPFPAPSSLPPFYKMLKTPVSSQ